MMQGFGAPAAQEQQQAPAPAGAGEVDQSELNKFIGMATMAIFDEKFLPKAVEALKKGGPLPQAIARLGVTVVGRIYEAAKSQGQPVSPQVLLLGGAEVIKKIAELAEKAGLPADQEAVEMAFFIAADMFKNHVKGLGDYTDEMEQEDAAAFIQSMGDDAMRQAVEKSQRALSLGAQQMPGAQFAMPEEEAQQ
ncbi:MAG: hypothetical protein KDK24_09955 [Pseudooceanicola sp.]|nr:hypothetical protein [Pseudooceanicola sp.]